MARATARPGTVIVDPPRAGLSKDAVQGVIRLGAERVVYVSCDVATLARDAKKIIESAQLQVSRDLLTERSKMPGMIAPLVDIAMGKITGLLCLGLILSWAQPLFASEEIEHVEFWSGIFWPYFQFVFFACAVIYLARAPISKLLDNQRIQLRSKLSESKQALKAAEQKSKDMELKLSQLTNEVEKLRLESVESSLREHEKIIAESKNIADQLIQDANRSAQNLVNANRNILTTELIDQLFAAVETKFTQDKLLQLDQKFSGLAVQQIKHLQ